MKKYLYGSLACVLTLVAGGVAADTFNAFRPADGILVGDEDTYITTPAEDSDIISLWSGTCDNTTFLRADGTCSVTGSGTPGNPTASLGLTAINGVASEYMRSDAAPALSQSIVPTWTGTHTFGAANTALSVSRSALARQLFNVTDAPGDEKIWDIRADSTGAYSMSTRTDADAAGSSFFSVDRTGTTVDSLALAATALTWNGSSMVNLASSPTWTGTHTFQDSAPRTIYNATGAPADEKIWHLQNGSGGNFVIQTRTDLDGSGASAITMTRTGTTVDSIALESTALTWNGSSMVNVASSPTWTGLHTFESTSPTIRLLESDASSDNQLWDINVQAEQIAFRALDDLGAETNWLAVDRTGNDIDSIAFRFDAPVGIAGGLFTPAVGVGFDITYGDALIGLLDNGATSSVLVQGSGSTLDQFSVTADAILLNGETPAVLGSNQTFTAANVFSQTFASGSLVGYPVVLSSAQPALALNETDGTADNRLWDMIANSDVLQLRVVNDAVNSATAFLTVERTGTTINSVTFPTSVAGAFRVGFSPPAGSVLNVGSDSIPAVTFTSNGTYSGGFENRGSTASHVPFYIYNNATSGNNVFAEFASDGTYTIRGSITYNRGAGLVAYNTTSDQRLKTKIKNAPKAGKVIDGIKVRQFDWKEPGHDHVDYGLIAQELVEVVPHAVTPGDEGEEIEKTWQIDNSKLVPMLIKEIQDLRKRVAELEAK